MRDLFVMWRSTRMVVLVALCAALYAAILIPFKIVPIIPGFTEVRPGNAIPIVCGLLFGPAAAWGCAIGNLIGDFFGTFGPGSFFGFFGNFLFAYVPYRIWVSVRGAQPPKGTWGEMPLLLFAVLAGSAACGVVIGWGLELLGMVPYAILTTIITINNSLIGVVLGIPLFILMYPRARRWRLTFSQIMNKDDITGTPASTIGGLLVVAGCLAGVLAAFDKGGTLANWISALGIAHFDAAIGGDGKPLPVSLFVPENMSFKQFGGLCTLAILAGSALMAKLGTGRRLVKPTSTGVGETGAAELAFADVSYAYEGEGEPAINGVSFTQGAGQRYFVMGRTGAGKSTLCMCLNGVIPHLQGGQMWGAVQVAGLDTHDWTVDQLSRVTGVVFQDFETQLFCSDVELEVAFGLENRGVEPAVIRERVDYWLNAMGLKALVGRDPNTLSGGEKQRLALASVMAGNPPIVVLDEPMTDLDPAGREQVMGAIEALADEGCTMLIVTDETGAALGGEKLLVMRAGELAYVGDPGGVLGSIAGARELGLKPDPIAELAEVAGLYETPANADALVKTLKSMGARINGPAFAKIRAEEAEHVHTPLAVGINAVRFGYGNVPVLEDVSLDIHHGEFVAILGPNGAGKTTLCKMFMGLLKPSAGSVTVDGNSVSDMTAPELAARIGYLYQNPDSQIFSDTVFDEVAFGPRNLGCDEEQVRERVAGALKITELDEYGSEDPFALTRGERQRVALAAILACAPDVIVFDEPTTGLDVPQQEAIMELLKRLQKQGRTVIMVTHHTEMALRYADRLILLKSGRVLADGPTREVVADAATFAQAGQTAPDVVSVSQQAFGESLLSVAEFRQFVALG